MLEAWVREWQELWLQWSALQWSALQWSDLQWSVLLWSVLLAAFGLWLWRWLRWYRRSRIAKRALGAERVALSLLRSRGYVVVNTQVRHVWPVQHGALHFDINLRADALVRRGSRRFIAEIKSTPLVADLKHGPTRRQLLEYAIAYGTDGVLLVDMHTSQIDEVMFPGLSRTRGRNPWSLFAVCLVGFAAGIWTSHLVA